LKKFKYFCIWDLQGFLLGNLLDSQIKINNVNELFFLRDLIELNFLAYVIPIFVDDNQNPALAQTLIFYIKVWLKFPFLYPPVFVFFCKTRKANPFFFVNLSKNFLTYRDLLKLKEKKVG
jgi:hypothetical protein